MNHRSASRKDRHEVGYAELHCKTNFSFLRGGSHADELVERAAELGYRAIAVTDSNSLAGVVRMHSAAKACGIPLVVGAEITARDALPMALYATDRASYGRLARLITRGRLRSPKGQCAIDWADVAEHSDGLIAIIFPGGGIARGQEGSTAQEGFKRELARYRDVFGDRLYLGAELCRGDDNAERLARLADAAARARVPLLAANDVHYHIPERQFLQDVLTCIREHCTLETAGTRLFANAERHLKSADEMTRLFRACPGAIRRTVEIADRCAFRLDELKYEYPEEVCPDGQSARARLADLTWRGARERYPGGVAPKIRQQIEHELKLIAELAYEPYFLTVWDIVRFARSRGILCQGRGSAANSAVCYCLGITAVDPDRIDVLFERFVSKERNEPPDIDVDFEHERREEVFQYIYDKYGRDRAGIVAEVITYRPRSAVRDVGKVLGLSLDRVDLLAKTLEWWGDEPLPADRLREAGLDPSDRTIRCLAKRVEELVGFPRHLSQHVGGFVISRGPLCEMVPIENGGMPGRTFIEWDKDDIDALGILKVDCLALGMLTATRKCLDIVNKRSEEALSSQLSALSSSRSSNELLALHAVPAEDPAVYDMICQADTVGVFQIESRAQMSMLPRLRPRCYYDLVIEVAIVRPGPIQGNMVHPYLRRRNGEEPVVYPTPELKEVLGKTLGVPLFQEQAMRLAVVAAGFTPGEADQLRRAMGAWRKRGVMERFRQKLLDGMRANGYSEEFARQVFEQISGFGEYGFPESHAASFALLVYVSAWLKRYHPAAFTAAILNSQPMGFYAPAQLVRDAQQHGVEVRPVDVSFSAYDCTLEEKARRHEGTKARREEGTGNRGNAETPKSRNAKTLSSSSSLPPLFSSPSPRGFVAPSLRPQSSSSSLRCSVAPSVPSQSSASTQPSRLVGEPSRWGADGPALRLGTRLVKGMSEPGVRGIEEARRNGPFRSVGDLWRRSRASRSVLARLAVAGAFRSLGLNRREALWQVLAIEEELPLFAGLDADEPAPALPDLKVDEEVVRDYDSIGLSLAAHPIALIRGELEKAGVVKAKELAALKHGVPVRVAGLVLVRQRPSTAGGIVFMTLEDESGIANLMVRPPVYERDRRAGRSAAALVAEGHIERQGDVVHVQARRLTDLSASLRDLSVTSRDFC